MMPSAVVSRSSRPAFAAFAALAGFAIVLASVPNASALAPLSVSAPSSPYFTPKMTDPSSITPYRNHSMGNAFGTLYAVAAPGYSNPFIVADLHGSHYEVGYLYGALLHQETADNYAALMNFLLKNNALLKGVFDIFLDWQYNSYLVKGLPQQFIDELNGIEQAGKDVGAPDTGSYVRRALVLASVATGDVKDDIEYLLIHELSSHGKQARAALAATGLDVHSAAALIAKDFNPLGRSCSMWGTWGSRTTNGKLYSGRNLDWTAQTGLANHKLVTVYHIPGRQTYAIVGFASLNGAITGMSKAGLTVHEAGDDNKEETLTGFAWSLRLRLIMENATNIEEARTLWAATENTLGLNHGIGSGSDGKMMVMETKAGYSAYFEDNDPREAALVVNGTHYGFPIKEAVWRTNHGYDPTFLKTVVGSIKPGSDTFNRYLLIHDTIVGYAEEQVPMDILQAINTTAIPGDKGGSSRESFLSCESATGGANIISAAFSPTESLMYLAFEDGLGDSHVPACCNNYVKMDLSKWF